MKYTYSSHIKPYSKTFSLIEVSDLELEKIDAFVRLVMDPKKGELHHQKDNRSEYKRFFTGILGEVALEKFLGVDGIVDWSIGDSKEYHKPDLSNLGIKVGVKTVEYGLFPIIFKKSYAPEIINISWKSKYVYICGLAKISVLNKYQSLDLVKDSFLKNRGTKTAFYGFEHLQYFNDIYNLKELITN